MAEADLQGETRGLEGAVLEELDVGGLVCDCVVRGEQGEEYWQRTQGHGGAGGGGGSQATAEAQTARFKAAKRWAEAAEAARKELPPPSGRRRRKKEKLRQLAAATSMGLGDPDEKFELT